MYRASFLLVLVVAACGGGNAGPDAAAASCADYCTEIMTNCTGTDAQYTNTDQCMAACLAFPQGTPGTQSGDSLECRVYHAGAALGDPDTHCVHAGPAGGGACGMDCEGFCQLDLAACTGTNAAYTSSQDCMTACAAMDDSVKYNDSIVSGNTVACRIYHASVATSDPVTHCPHTEPVSAVCQ
jgi:hypothetical protein